MRSGRRNRDEYFRRQSQLQHRNRDTFASDIGCFSVQSSILGDSPRYRCRINALRSCNQGWEVRNLLPSGTLRPEFGSSSTAHPKSPISRSCRMGKRFFRDKAGPDTYRGDISRRLGTLKPSIRTPHLVYLLCPARPPSTRIYVRLPCRSIYLRHFQLLSRCNG